MPPFSMSIDKDGKKLVNYISRLIYSLNDQTVELCISKIQALQPGQQIALKKEYYSFPDSRWGDNLIGAVQYMIHKGDL